MENWAGFLVEQGAADDAKKIRFWRQWNKAENASERDPIEKKLEKALSSAEKSRWDATRSNPPETEAAFKKILDSAVDKAPEETEEEKAAEAAAGAEEPAKQDAASTNSDKDKIEYFKAWFDGTQDDAQLKTLWNALDADEKKAWNNLARDGTYKLPNQYELALKDFKSKILDSGVNKAPEDTAEPAEPEQPAAAAEQPAAAGQEEGDVFSKVTGGGWKGNGEGKAMPNADKRVVDLVLQLQKLVGAEPDGVFGTETAGKVRNAYRQGLGN